MMFQLFHGIFHVPQNFRGLGEFYTELPGANLFRNLRKYPPLRWMGGTTGKNIFGTTGTLYLQRTKAWDPVWLGNLTVELVCAQCCKNILPPKSINYGFKIFRFYSKSIPYVYLHILIYWHAPNLWIWGFYYDFAPGFWISLENGGVKSEIQGQNHNLTLIVHDSSACPKSHKLGF